jgi:hypothetical protein
LYSIDQLKAIGEELKRRGVEQWAKKNKNY